MTKPIKNSITVRNAGIVLLNNYISILFERLNLIENRKFITVEHQYAAVQYLQYVVTGMDNTDDYLLPLCKIVCGVAVEETVATQFNIASDREMLVDGLINAAIAHWPVIGDCSVNGFRGNWLVRDGLLTEYEDKWDLTVEKKAYDLLIYKSPFSFSIINYPWMSKPLHVNWPY